MNCCILYTCCKSARMVGVLVQRCVLKCCFWNWPNMVTAYAERNVMCELSEYAAYIVKILINVCCAERVYCVRIRVFMNRCCY